MSKRIARASVLWIDADPVFGGSGSQVQFPVELREFFALPAKPAIGDHVSRSIHCAGLPFDGKKMDFHHNDMWRLNLPTANQGLGGYGGHLLVFEKTANEEDYLFWLVSKGSPIARKLRAHTVSHGRLGYKRRDNGTKRRFGFF